MATLEHARDLAREARLKNPQEGVTVWIGGGNYYLSRPFELVEKDSGTAIAPTIYRAVAGETPRLVAARKVVATDFKVVTDPQVLERIQKEARGKVYELDLAEMKVTHIRPYPDVFSDTGGMVDLYFGGTRMPLSRFPNQGFMTIKRVVDNAGGITSKQWDGNGVNWEVGKGLKNGGTFEYREEFYAKMELWKKVLDHGVWFKGYWRIPWQNEAMHVQSVDTERHTVTFAKPVAGGIGNKYKRPEGNGKEPYWVMNLLEEVDQPGEWCVDFKEKKLYFYPPTSLGSREILLADQSEAAIRVVEASHLALEGLTVDSGLSDGILIEGGESNLVAGCTVRNVDKYAVVVDGGKNHVVQSCDLYQLGGGGIWLGGGDENSDPRVPAGHRVVNNHIHHFSEIQRIYTPGVNCGFTGGGGGGHHPAVGMYVGHNLIHDTPHMGVLSGSWDNLFEYNEVFRYCTMSNDGGGFYCYDQYERDGNETFRYNLVHGSDDGDGIYFDNDHRDMHVYGNILCLNSAGGSRGTGFIYKIGSQAKNPHSIECYNNVAIFCNYGFSFVTALKSRIENNVCVQCPTPWTWRQVIGGKSVDSTPEAFGAGLNRNYDSNPGFVDIGALDFHLKPGAKLLTDLPGFKPIPVDKIGLYVDFYRTTLPSDVSLDRFNRNTRQGSTGFDVEDRK